MIALGVAATVEFLMEQEFDRVAARVPLAVKSKPSDN